jgi:poly-gamma-glutamate capsule biosynthesis protein CapA/YwtB (metallophosphatase superfamily)
MTYPARMSLALTGDSIILRRISRYDDDATAKLYNLIKSADVAFTNLEVLPNNFAGHPAVESGGSHFAAHDWVVDDLESLGFDLFSCANNHALDYSTEGCTATIEVLERKGVAFAGIGRNLGEARMPVYFDSPAGSVAMISCSSTFAKGQQAGEQRPEMQGRPGLNPIRYETVYELPADTLIALRQIADDLGVEQRRLERVASGFGFPPDDPAIFPFMEQNFRAAAKAAIRTTPHEGDMAAIAKWTRESATRADLVMISLHAHEQGDHKEEPAEFIPVFCREMIDAGADMVVGHGPHLIRGMEIYKGKPIFYSLGNFIGQNELVWKLPADSYERFRVDASKTPGDVYRSRTKNDQQGFPSDKKFWESLMPVTRYDEGKLTGIDVYPVTLGLGEPEYRRGRPRLAQGEEAAAILERFASLSEAFGTKLNIDGEKASVELE